MTSVASVTDHTLPVIVRSVRVRFSSVGVVAVGDGADLATWSGIPFHITRTLRALGLRVVDISPLRTPWPRFRHARFLAERRLGRSYRYELDSSVVASWNDQVAQRLAADPPDLVLSTSALAVCDLVTDAPLVVWADATFENLQQSYAEYQGLPGRTVSRAHRFERSAATQAQVLAFASDWAASSAVTTYGADPARVHVVPFGANAEPPQGFVVEEVVNQRQSGPCRLVWVGSDWQRKRGDFAAEVLTELRALGVDACLTMLGDRPPAGFRLPDHAEHLGYVDRRTVDGAVVFDGVMRVAAFNLLPSRAEAFGIAVAEGNAYGVPCFAAAVGGLRAAVRPGVNGKLFAADADAASYARAIADTWAEAERYRSLAYGARDEFERRLNWRASCSTILSLAAEAR